MVAVEIAGTATAIFAAFAFIRVNRQPQASRNNEGAGLEGVVLSVQRGDSEPVVVLARVREDVVAFFRAFEIHDGAAGRDRSMLSTFARP